MNKTFLWVDLSFFNQSYPGGITTTKMPTGYWRYYLPFKMSTPLLTCSLASTPWAMSLCFKFRAIYFWLLNDVNDDIGQNISHYTTAKLSAQVWMHDLIWWQKKDRYTKKHFHKITITSSWTLSKTKIPIIIVKAEMPSNPNQKSPSRDNNTGDGDRLTIDINADITVNGIYWNSVRFVCFN